VLSSSVALAHKSDGLGFVVASRRNHSQSSMVDLRSSYSWLRVLDVHYIKPRANLKSRPAETRRRIRSVSDRDRLPLPPTRGADVEKRLRTRRNTERNGDSAWRCDHLLRHPANIDDFAADAELHAYRSFADAETGALLDEKNFRGMLPSSVFISKAVREECRHPFSSHPVSTSSCAVAKRPRDASCLSVVSTVQHIERSHLLLVT